MYCNYLFDTDRKNIPFCLEEIYISILYILPNISFSPAFFFFSMLEIWGFHLMFIPRIFLIAHVTPHYRGLLHVQIPFSSYWFLLFLVGYQCWSIQLLLSRQKSIRRMFLIGIMWIGARKRSLCIASKLPVNHCKEHDRPAGVLLWPGNESWVIWKYCSMAIHRILMDLSSQPQTSCLGKDVSSGAGFSARAWKSVGKLLWDCVTWKLFNMHLCWHSKNNPNGTDMQTAISEKRRMMELGQWNSPTVLSCSVNLGLMHST